MKKFGKKQRIYLYQFCADMIEAELPLYDSLQKLRAEGKKLLGGGFAKRLEALTTKMANTTSISMVFEGYVPDSELSVINAAERSGSLADGFRTLVNVINYNSELKQKIVGAVMFPLIMLVLSLIVIAGYAYKVFPAFESVVPVAKWPGVTQVLFTFGMALCNGLWIYILCAAIAAAITINIAMGKLTGPLRNNVIDRIVPFSTYKQLVASIFLNNLALMLRNKIPLHDALSIISMNATGWLRWHIADMQGKMTKGMSYGEALNSGLLNAEALLNISLYAALPSFNEVLMAVSDKSRESIRVYIGKLSGLLKALSTLVLGGCVIWVFAALFALSDKLAAMGASGSF
ncbi:type II secretion system F family protein [Enterobacter sp. ENT03]|uniref:type II secretion system F family protein n=1 Tax=Enterobacter sp. ENT03 TaxID=2854780 RepID=UPI001C47C97E|nr:type II secretion system F family protein [Enterobacter sp. ENT03]MBV7404125.1 type II secretion system F family protein [Enterobacter sp. ENT03]